MVILASKLNNVLTRTARTLEQDVSTVQQKTCDLESNKPSNLIEQFAISAFSFRTVLENSEQASLSESDTCRNYMHRDPTHL